MIRLGFSCATFLLFATPLLGQGTIQGKVVDRSGGTMPGVTIAVTGADSQRTVVTDPGGSYRLTDLVPGRYSVRATLAGFCTETKDNVTVTDRQVADVQFMLMVAGLMDVSWITVDAPHDFRQADAVVYLRVDRVVGPRPWETSPCRTVTTPEYRATILAVAKSHPKLTSVRFTFLNGHMNYGEPGYVAGDEFVAFLNWDDGLGAFFRKNGPPMLYPVRGGRVDARWGLDVENMSVEDLLAKLRALAKQGR